MLLVNFLSFAKRSKDILRINMTVEKNAMAQNETFAAAANNAKAKNGRLHLLGLVRALIRAGKTIIIA